MFVFVRAIVDVVEVTVLAPMVVATESEDDALQFRLRSLWLFPSPALKVARIVFEPEDGPRVCLLPWFPSACISALRVRREKKLRTNLRTVMLSSSESSSKIETCGALSGGSGGRGPFKQAPKSDEAFAVLGRFILDPRRLREDVWCDTRRAAAAVSSWELACARE